jgi:hypothetical protein
MGTAMLGRIDHHGARRLVRGPDEAPPLRGLYCVLIVLAWLLFLAVTIDWIMSMKGVG